MSRTFLIAFVVLAVALSMIFATDIEALGGSGKSVAAWGGNRDGQLGDGTTTMRLTPVEVQNLSGVKAVDAGGRHSLALKGDGTVWAWGP